MIGILKHRQINCPRLPTSSVWWRYNLNPECLKPMSISLTYLRYVSRKNTFANHEHWHRWHLIISITSLYLPINRTVDIYIQSVHFCQINGCWSFRNHLISGFPHGSHHKESACNVGDLGLIPGLVRSPGEGNDNSFHYSCLEISMDRGAWQAKVHEVTKSRTWLSDFHTSLKMEGGEYCDLALKVWWIIFAASIPVMNHTYISLMNSKRIIHCYL